MKIRYIYFENYSIIGDSVVTNRIQNVNVLVIKPNTNSSGVWVFTNMTKRYGTEYCKVEQNWIDLEKYKFKNSALCNDIKKCLEILKPQIRTFIIDDLLEDII